MPLLSPFAAPTACLATPRSKGASKVLHCMVMDKPPELPEPPVDGAAAAPTAATGPPGVAAPLYDQPPPDWVRSPTMAGVLGRFSRRQSCNLPC